MLARGISNLTVRDETHKDDAVPPATNRHYHDAMLPVTGITFLPDTVSPNPTYHTIPTIDHSTANHVPPYFALCYIQRVD